MRGFPSFTIKNRKKPSACTLFFPRVSERLTAVRSSFSRHPFFLFWLDYLLLLFALCTRTAQRTAQQKWARSLQSSLATRRCVFSCSVLILLARPVCFFSPLFFFILSPHRRAHSCVLHTFSAILYKLKLGQNVSTIPTVGFNVETVTFKKVKFNVWVCSNHHTFLSFLFPTSVFSLLCQHYHSSNRMLEARTRSVLCGGITLRGRRR